MMKKFLTITMVLIMILSAGPKGVSAAESTCMPTDRTAARDDCIMVAVEGRYVVDQDTALQRINAIRKEACDNGYIDPYTGEKLTPQNYRPLIWSEDLEFIARIRAAEASVNRSHVRLNGRLTADVLSPNGIQTYSECLAYHTSAEMLRAVEMWYEEKADYLAGIEGNTGHYKDLITNRYTHIGIGSFIFNAEKSYTTTAAEFNDFSDVPYSISRTKKPAVSGTQMLEILPEYVKSCTVSAMENGAGLNGVMNVTLINGSKGYVVHGATWSCDTRMGTINSTTGVYTGKQCGNVVITGCLKNTALSASNTFLGHAITSETYLKYPTCTIDGSKSYKCGCSQKTWTAAVPKTGHIYTCTTDRCSKCGCYKPEISTAVPSMKVRSISRSKNYITVKWRNNTKVKGYQIRYSTNADMSKSTVVTVSRYRTTSKKIKKLKRKTKYYVQIRSYKVINGKTKYSIWSSIKATKTK